jgi:uncharacterized protein (TIGR02118 family)
MFSNDASGISFHQALESLLKDDHVIPIGPDQPGLTEKFRFAIMYLLKTFGCELSPEDPINTNSTTKKIQMKFRILISFLVLTASFAAFGQEKQSRKSQKHNSAIGDKGLVKVTVMYPFAEGKTFNMDYYENKHMPMVAKFLGSNLVKYTIEKGLSSGIPNQPLPYMAVGTFYVKDLADYQTAIAPNRDAIRADFTNYTNIVPVILVSEVVR